MELTPREIRQAKRRVVEADGFRTLAMHEHALRVLAEIPEGFEPFAVHMMRGEIYRDLGQFAPALEELNRAGLLQPGNIHVLLAKAWCFKRTDRLPQAIAVTRQALLVEPDDVIVNYNLACYYCLAERKTECLKYLLKALKLRPEMVHSIPEERDFDKLRHDPDFRLINRLFRMAGDEQFVKRLQAAAQSENQGTAKPGGAQPKSKSKAKPKRRPESKRPGDETAPGDKPRRNEQAAATPKPNPPKKRGSGKGTGGTKKSGPVGKSRPVPESRPLKKPGPRKKSDEAMEPGHAKQPDPPGKQGVPRKPGVRKKPAEGETPGQGKTSGPARSKRPGKRGEGGPHRDASHDAGTSPE